MTGRPCMNLPACFVLRPKAVAYIQIPWQTELLETDEDSGITDPQALKPKPLHDRMCEGFWTLRTTGSLRGSRAYAMYSGTAAWPSVTP
jgi:hypothetical protein